MSTHDQLGQRHVAADGERFGAEDPALDAVVAAATLMPAFTDDAVEAGRVLLRDGAAVLRGVAVDDDDDLDATLRAVVGDQYGRVVSQCHQDHLDGGPLLQLHHDYGANWPAHPDHLFLLCVEDATDGGESVLADCWALLDAAAADPATAGCARLLAERDVVFCDAPGSDEVVVGRIDAIVDGRRVVNRTPYERPLDDDASDTDLIEALWRWDDVIWTAWTAAPRFRLQPGYLLCIDNHRVAHGRDAFGGRRRLRVTLVESATSVTNARQPSRRPTAARG